MTLKEKSDALLLSLPPFKKGIEIFRARGALNNERWLRFEKIKECMRLREENRELRDALVKQRIALDAFSVAHKEDMAEMTASLRKVYAKLAAAEAERDRYRDALRRAFPSGRASPGGPDPMPTTGNGGGGA